MGTAGPLGPSLGTGEHAGRVLEFDEHRGLGQLEDADGVRRRFHCTEIADGTRTVKVGAVVTFTVIPGPLGGFEAGAIRTR